jgi:hypothetical protein
MHFDYSTFIYFFVGLFCFLRTLVPSDQSSYEWGSKSSWNRVIIQSFYKVEYSVQKWKFFKGFIMWFSIVTSVNLFLLNFMKNTTKQSQKLHLNVNWMDRSKCFCIYNYYTCSSVGWISIRHYDHSEYIKHFQRHVALCPQTIRDECLREAPVCPESPPLTAPHKFWEIQKIDRKPLRVFCCML